MKYLFSILFFTLGLCFNAQILHYEIDNSITLTSFDIPNATDLSIPMADFNFLGENIKINFFFNSIKTGPGNLILSPFERSIGYECISGNAEFIPPFSLAEAFVPGDLIQDPIWLSLPQASFYSEGYLEGDIWGVDAYTYFVEQSSEYLGFYVLIDGQKHFGWLKFNQDWSFNQTFTLEELAIESSPNLPITVGSTTSLALPRDLNITYLANGISLNWTPIADAQGCQVKGGLVGDNDPHSFITLGNEPSELFINGNTLITGQEYQWRVRCATGINPYSGISDWSSYDYFTYNP